MTDPVQTAIYGLGVDPSQWTSGMQSAASSSENFVNSAERVTVQTENVSTATRSSADAIARLEARIDSSVDAQQKHERAINQVSRALEEGVISQERAAQMAQKLNDYYGKDLPTTFSGFSEKAVGAFEKIKETAAALGSLMGVAVAGGFLEMAKSAIESITALDEEAKRVGMNVEAFQALKLVMQQAGVSGEEYTRGLNKLSIELGDAENNVGKSRTSFAAWGIDIGNAKDGWKNLEQVLPEVSDRMKSITDAQTRYAMASELLGTRNVSWINALAEGSKAMAEHETKMRSLGAVMGGDFVTKVHEAGENLKLFGDIITGNLAIGIDKGITKINDLVVAFVKASSLIQELSSKPGYYLGKLFGGGVDDLQEAMKRLDELEAAAEHRTKSVIGSAADDNGKPPGFFGDSKSSGLTGDSLTPKGDGGPGFKRIPVELNKELDDYLAKLQKLHDLNSVLARDQAVQKAAADAEDMIRKSGGNVEDYTDKIQKIKDAAGKNYDQEHNAQTQKALDDYLYKLQHLHDMNSLNERDQAMQAAEDNARSIAREKDGKVLDDYIEKVRAAAAANYDFEHQMQGTKALDEYIGKLKTLQDPNSLSARDQAIQQKVGEAQSIIDKYKMQGDMSDYIAQTKEAAAANYDHAQAVQAVTAASKEMSSDLVTGLENVLEGTKSVTAALANLLTQFEQIILKAAILNPLQNYMTGLFSSSASGGGSMMGGFLGDIFGGFRASGGPVSAGMLYAVNENSLPGSATELFQPSTDGNIIPLGGSMSGQSSASGGGFNFSANINVVVPDKVSSNPAASRQAVNQIAIAARSAVRDELVTQLRTGGLLRRG